MADPFTVTSDDSGLVTMKLVGTLSEKNYDILKTQVEDAKKQVKELSLKKRGMIKIIFDLSDFSGVYNVAAMAAMKELGDHNKPFAAKTAVWGGSDLARIAADITIALIGNPTVKMFKTKEEADEWLKK